MLFQCKRLLIYENTHKPLLLTGCKDTFFPALRNIKNRDITIIISSNPSPRMVWENKEKGHQRSCTVYT
ncbi:hypothetical protein DRF67_16170 [Chryseobacterium pennipullorum]|uniref:Uncharacterized protein n=1 Tax=Chryseobacterium pennipullorum TaxID=2258963 RepID=A0A3D9AVT3_9FLAO|nr:hypothetical protein DRF67_16170 [Chryseobacterium pennipullorum]